MAGTCTGPGLTTGPDGKIEVQGARELVWPNEGACHIAANNGLFIDPVTGNLWVRPAGRVLRKTTTGASITAVPTVSGTYPLTTLTHEQTALECSSATFVGILSGGYIGQRMGNGNWWAVERYVTVYKNAVPIGFTGSQPVASLENNSGGVLGTSGAVDPLTVSVDLDPGDTVKVVAAYEHHRLAFTTAVANGYDWRPPSITGLLFTHP